MNNYLALFDLLKEKQAISDIWKSVLTMLKNQYDVSDDLLNLFCLFFSLVDDGNICIPLNTDKLKAKWNKKLEGLDATDANIDYDTIIEKGIVAAKNSAGNNPLIFQYDNPDNIPENNMFVIYKDWMFTEKFFNAKQTIVDSVKHIFSEQTISADDKEQSIENTKKKYGNTLSLEPEQIDAVVRAKHGQNLIITGGPGTGKTTVICYLLLELLSENTEREVYMAAPSGKAANRMKESIINSLNRLSLKNQTAYKKISDNRPLTVHKLLSLSNINTHEIKKFPENSIFIIDESSMIDVVLFAKLLNTIKQSDGARVFLLGDQDQIPSVQPGAVFCDLTTKLRGKNCLIELTKTHRFPSNSDIYKLKESIRNNEEASADWQNGISDAWQQELKSNAKGYPVKYITISEDSQIKVTVKDWYDAFYDNEDYAQVYSGMSKENPKTEIIQTLDAIWSHLEHAKILCAENYGPRGTKTLNKIISEYITNKFHIAYDDNDNFFIGKQVIVTKNQGIYDLSNGDLGIIVSFDNKKYMMIKREDTTKNSNNTNTQRNDEIIFRRGDYIFYPLYLLPSDSIEPAYAITIHKSQGSEYNNILIFLPESGTSPLLNRQILYTAITRTKHATYIVSDQENLKKAINTPHERDTQLFL